MSTERTRPVFGVDYDVGWFFFTATSGNVVSCGIKWFSRGEVPTNFTPSHEGVVTGENKTREALPQGVVESDLEKYFQDPHCRIVFRRPRGWTPEMGKRVAATAERLSTGKDGKPKPYAYGLIVGHFAAQNILGRLLGVLTFGYSSKLILRLADRAASSMCSEFCADVKKEQPELRGRGILQIPSYAIRPLSSYQDGFIWDL